MNTNISRRTFIKKTAQYGTVTVTVGSLILNMCGESGTTAANELVEMAVVKGENNFDITLKAVELLGGMKKFVPANSKVAILPNSQHKNPGTHTKPEIVRAVIKMCKDAGAKEINCLSWLPEETWDSTGLRKVVEESGANLKIVDFKNESLFRPVPIEKGKIFKEARIMDAFFENDIFINIPVSKDHAGNKFTGSMKNLMGLNSPKTNRFFHTGNFENDNIEHLDQCIADLNTVIKPDLCIVDATEFIITNGPFGPGKLHKPMKVVAGTDRIAIDAYCSTLWGLNPAEIIMINRGYQHGLGEIDFSKKKIKSIEI